MPLIFPTEARKADFKYIHKHLAEHKATGSMDAIGKAIVRMLKFPEFQAIVAGNVSLQQNDNSVAYAKRLVWAFLYSYLYRRDYVAAALILWGPNTFSPEPKSVATMWHSLYNYNLINVMGCASAGKTFSPSAWCLLDWVLDPSWTRVSVISNSEDHVKKNLFGDLIRLHSESAIELPGKVDSESISIDKKRAMGIFVLTIPGGPTSRGKLKGTKVKNRPHHPLFGENSRLRVILDEAQEVVGSVWDDVPNLLASVDNSTEHIKVLAAANPKLEFSRYGQNCKPVGGWDSIRDDQDEWESETGWHVISINALRTENVMHRRTIFPRMITWEGVQKIIKSQGGGNSEHPNCYTYLWGRFPKSGLMSVVVKVEHVRKSEGEWVFDDRVVPLFSNDPAYTGDNPAVASGRVGRAIAWVDFNGVRHELPAPKMAVQVDAVGILERGDTQSMASEILERCRQLNVRPGGFGIDRTGVGQGIHDIVRRQWRQKVGAQDVDGNDMAGIVGIHYAEKATDIKICEEDSQTPREMYDRIATELYFAAAKLLESDCVRFGRGVDPRTYEEMCARQGGMQVGLGRKLTLEGKDSFRARTGTTSPDRADAVTILLHVARTTTVNLIPKAKDTEAAPPTNTGEPWAGFDLAFRGAELAGFSGDKLNDMTKD